MKALFVERALRLNVKALGREFAETPHLLFAPVQRQLFECWRSVNRVRRTAGLEPLPIEAVPWKRRIVQPFKSVSEA